MKKAFFKCLLEPLYKHNQGNEKEYQLNYYLTGTVRRANSTPFYVSGDIGDLQVKSSRATVCFGLDIREHIKHDAANKYAYVCDDMKTYFLLEPDEYADFVERFKTVDRDSYTGKTKLRLKAETWDMIYYLESRCGL